MHVLLVVPGGVDRSGRDRVIPVLLEFLERIALRHRVTVLVLGQEPEDSRYPLLGAQVVNVRLPRSSAPVLAQAGLADLVRRSLAAVAAEGRPQVVHGFWASVSGMIAVAAGRRFRAPVVVSAAGGELLSRPDLDYGGGRGLGGRLIARAAFDGADVVTVGSAWMAEHVRGAGHRVHEIVPLGVDCTRFRPAPPGTAIPARLVSVAGLNKVKDPFLLLEAMTTVRAAVPHASLELAGIDTLDGAVQRRAAELGLGGAVSFTGQLPSELVPEHLQRAELHLLASHHDAAPVAVLEAAACGVPTIGTRVGHVTDLAALTPPAAVVVDSRDPAVLGSAVIELLADPARRRAIGAAALTWAVAHRAETTAAAFDEIYRRLVARPVAN